MATRAEAVEPSERRLATAMNDAQNVAYHRAMKNQVLALIIQCIDLPFASTTDLAHQSATDAELFKRGLSCFQPSDSDELVLERNIYDRCGYALCPRINAKVTTKATHRIIWGTKTGQKFQVVPKAELEKWCSAECAERATFVRLQLSQEPIRIRGAPAEGIRLLEESSSEEDMLADDLQRTWPQEWSNNSFARNLRRIGVTQGNNVSNHHEITERLNALSLERGEPQEGTRSNAGIKVFERTVDHLKLPPPQIQQSGVGEVEGLQSKQVRFVIHQDHYDDIDVDEDAGPENMDLK